jgi:hypothetical protein
MFRISGGRFLVSFSTASRLTNSQIFNSSKYCNSIIVWSDYLLYEEEIFNYIVAATPYIFLTVVKSGKISSAIDAWVSVNGKQIRKISIRLRLN